MGVDVSALFGFLYLTLKKKKKEKKKKEVILQSLGILALHCYSDWRCWKTDFEG